MGEKMENNHHNQEGNSRVIEKVQHLIKGGENIREMRASRAFESRIEAGIEQVLNGAEKIQLDKPYTFIEMTAQQPDDMQRVEVVERDGKKVYITVNPIVS